MATGLRRKSISSANDQNVENMWRLLCALFCFVMLLPASFSQNLRLEKVNADGDKQRMEMMKQMKRVKQENQRNLVSIHGAKSKMTRGAKSRKEMVSL